MLMSLFFWLGVVNNLALLTVFILRRWRFTLIEKYGWIYLLLAVPALFGAILATQEEPLAIQYLTFLLIFLGFLLLEGLYDWVWKIPFREEMNWKALVPYVALYMSSNYGFVVMTWRVSLFQGTIILALFLMQFGANIATHPKKDKHTANSSASHVP